MPMSTAVERKILDHLSTKTAFTPAGNFLALVTTAVVTGDTGATIVEAAYTGYARKTIAAADWNAATGAAPASNTTNVTETFGACTAGTSTVIGWAVLDVVTAGAGNILMYGTATSTVISTTQTPPTVASGGLVWQLT